MSFQEFELHPELLKAITGLGHTTPTPIQMAAIPKILQGNDMRGSASTGTGKTGAFLIPVIHKLTNPPTSQARGPRALVLVPTRELAIQVANEANKYCKYLSRMKTVCIYGGAPYPIQNRELSRHYELLIATPGRLMDHMERGKIDFSRLEVLILDEADRMLDMGFIGPVEEIAAATPADRQTLLFSATLKGSVMNLSKKLLRNPIEVSVEPTQVECQKIEQHLYQVDGLDHKNKILEHLLTDDAIKQVIIFTATKHHADVLKNNLNEIGHSAASLHGDMNQRQRNRTIAEMKKGSVRVLVATDVAARGIDIHNLSHVINFDLPNSEEDYVHRIGRTGRAGASGIALSFASSNDVGIVRRIEQYTGIKIPHKTVEGLEPKPRRQGGGGGDSRPQGGPPRARGTNLRGPSANFSQRSFKQPYQERSSASQKEFKNFNEPREPKREFRGKESRRFDGKSDGRFGGSNNQQAFAEGIFQANPKSGNRKSFFGEKSSRQNRGFSGDRSFDDRARAPRKPAFGKPAFGHQRPASFQSRRPMRDQ